MASNDRKALIDALARLDGNHDFQQVLNVIRQHRDIAMTTLREASELMQLGRAQGAAQAFDDLLTLAEQARDHIATMRQQQAQNELRSTF